MEGSVKMVVATVAFGLAVSDCTINTQCDQLLELSVNRLTKRVCLI
jgi:hypothetical protein